MNRRAFQAYQKTQMSAMSERNMEELAFMRSIGFLKQAKGNVADFDAYSQALRFNQKLWSLVQTSVLDSTSRISGSLKISLLDLSLFIDRHTLHSLINPADEKLDILIDINVNITGALIDVSKPPNAP